MDFLFVFFLMIRRPPRSTLFPYTTLSDLVERFSGCDVVEAPELLSGAERLGLGVVPRPAESHELRPVHPTDAGIPGPGVRLAPASRCLAPFGRSLIVGQLFARPHHVAVDAPGDLWAELTAYGRGHRFIDQRHPLCQLSLRDQHAADVMHGQGLKVAIVEASGEIAAPSGEPQC